MALALAPRHRRPQRRFRAARRNNANALLFTKIIKGMEPGEDSVSDPKQSMKKTGRKNFSLHREDVTLCLTD